MTKLPETEDDDLVVELSHSDILEETIERLEKRGFEPVLIAFRDATGEVEVLSRGGIELAAFVNWLASTWVPASRDLHRGRGPGN